MATIFPKFAIGHGNTDFRRMKILVLNSGSSTLKSSLFEIGDAPPEAAPAAIWEARAEWQASEARINSRGKNGATTAESLATLSRKDAVFRLLNALCTGKTQAVSSLAEISVVGHRIVHGGLKYERPVLIDADIEAEIERLSNIAPLHNQTELEVVRAVKEVAGQVPQVAVFDTSFHRRMPEAAAVYPGPYEWLAAGIRRYGFHGTSHQYCAERAAQMLGRELQSLKIVTCHLGNGCSLAAIQTGRSVDTSMGFTPLEGLMMGTRSGSVDPGILTYLLQRDGCSPKELYATLNSKSGLLGVSGLSSDMREILAAWKQGHARAKLAFDIFVHRLRSGIGAMVATLGGIDALVFTAGIGENSPEVRAAACANFGYLGIHLDEQRNAAPSSDREISTKNSTVRVLVIRAQEDWAIARECWKLVQQARSSEASSA